MDSIAALSALETGDMFGLVDALDWTEVRTVTVTPPGPLALIMPTMRYTIARTDTTVLMAQGTTQGKAEVMVHGPHADAAETATCYQEMVSVLAEHAQAAREHGGVVEDTDAQVQAQVTAWPSLPAVPASVDATVVGGQLPTGLYL